MLELLILMLFLGALFSSRSKMGIANPFSIYFLSWFLIIVAYYLSAGSYIKISPDFLFTMLAAKILAFSVFLMAYNARPDRLRPSFSNQSILPRKRLLLIAQILATLALPLTYRKALEFTGGASLFSVQGFTLLRYSFVQEGLQFGILIYFSVLSFVVTSIRVCMPKKNGSDKILFFLSFLVSLSFVYLNTGRTTALQLLLLIGIPLVMLRIVQWRGVLISFLFFFVLFVCITAMTEKGISFDSGVAENVKSASENIRSYVVAPFLAFSSLEASNLNPQWGDNSFRLIITILHTLGASSKVPVSLIREYIHVPDVTNVYTVYEPYFLDFSYAGIFIPPLFLIGHWWLYRRAEELGGKWIFYYSASTFPLAMQFFQDQYFSLLSIWIQIAFWYWLLMEKSESNKIKNRKIGPAAPIFFGALSGGVTHD